MIPKLPHKVRVAEIVSSRYPSHTRPSSWDERHEGFDVVRTTEGEVITLLSDGGQSPPQHGWEIMLTRPATGNAFAWTLYGLPRS